MQRRALFESWAACAAFAVFFGWGCDDGSAATSAGGSSASSGTHGSTNATSSHASSATGSGSSTSSGVSSAPHVGAHGLSYYGYGANSLASIDSPSLTTKSGSTLLVASGRGALAAAAPPTDNLGNAPFAPIGTPHAYTMWPSSGTDLHAFVGATGGPGHVVTTANQPGDEITLAVVEVENGTKIQDAQWVERLQGQPITSASVTTTGPATLVAFWWGDADVGGDKVATPDNGFVVLDSIGDAGALVQCFVAAREVAAAGTYDVTWTATPDQGAQLWLVAVQ